MTMMSLQVIERYVYAQAYISVPSALLQQNIQSKYFFNSCIRLPEIGIRDRYSQLLLWRLCLGENQNVKLLQVVVYYSQQFTGLVCMLIRGHSESDLGLPVKNHFSLSSVEQATVSLHSSLVSHSHGIPYLLSLRPRKHPRPSS